MKTIKEQVDELRKAGYRLPAAQMKVVEEGLTPVNMTE